MARQIGSIRNLRTIEALRGEPLKIDLGREYNGVITAWMKKDIKAPEFIGFLPEENNRYLILRKYKTEDFYDGKNTMAGRWYFDVRFRPQGVDKDDEKVIITGTIMFYDNVTVVE